MDVTEVFTPNRYPDHTYVSRGEEKLEDKLSQEIRTPGGVVSLSGPSKSGKTVLVQNVVDDNSLIIVQGSGIESAQDLWNEVLDEIGVPSSTEHHENQKSEFGGSIKTSLKGILPGLSARDRSERTSKIVKRIRCFETIR